MGLGTKAPSALDLELPGAGHVTRFAASAECVVDFELRSQQGGVSRKRHAFFAWIARRALIIARLLFMVIPAKAGIQLYSSKLDPDFRRGDE